MGLFQNLFYKLWLVQAYNVRGGNFESACVRFIIKAPTREQAENKLRVYLIAENFQFGKVEATLG